MNAKPRLIMAFTAIMACMPLLSNGAEYEPILQEGRMWVLSNQPAHIHDNFAPVSVATIGCDTVVDGKNCVNIDITTLSLQGTYKSTETVCEEDGRLWWWKESCGKFILLIDMTAEDGDLIPVYNGEESGEDIGSFMVKEVGSVDIWDGPRKVLGIYNEDGSYPLTYWVEGVGSTNCIYEATFDVHPGDSTYLTQCFNQGEWECFNLMNFEKKMNNLPQTGINEIPSEKAANGGAMYDLNGIRIKNSAKGDFYVKDRSLHMQN